MLRHQVEESIAGAPDQVIARQDPQSPWCCVDAGQPEREDAACDDRGTRFAGQGQSRGADDRELGQHRVSALCVDRRPKSQVLILCGRDEDALDVAHHALRPRPAVAVRAGARNRVTVVDLRALRPGNELRAGASDCIGEPVAGRNRTRLPPAVRCAATPSMGATCPSATEAARRIDSIAASFGVSVVNMGDPGSFRVSNIDMKSRSYASPLRARAAEATRERILEAAFARFSTDYYEDVTLDAIAADADVTVQTVLRGFGNKENLVRTLTQSVTPQVTAQRDEAPSGDILQAVANVVDHYEAIGDLVMLLLRQEEQVAPFADATAFGKKYHSDGSTVCSPNGWTNAPSMIAVACTPSWSPPAIHTPGTCSVVSKNCPEKRLNWPWSRSSPGS